MKFTCSILLGLIVAASAQAQSRPNLLFILGDDITYSDLPCYGGQNVSTPNIDSLARDGMRFTRAYCAMSMCAPFRAELYTGLYPVRNGVAWNHSWAKPGTQSVCHYLREQGYRVGLSGKKHASPAETFPFDNLRDFPAGPAIRDYMTQTQPFCLFICSHNAHPPWRSGDTSKLDAEAIQLPPVIHDNPPTRDTYTRYLAEIEALDDEVGQVLNALQETGHEKDTLVMFCSEQGWDFAFGKWTNWDPGVHTGLITRWPGKIRPSTKSTALVQMADVVPTMIAVAGGDPTAYKLDGRSFLPVLRGEATKHREYVYMLHNNVPEGEPYPIRSIRDDRYHYLHNLTPDRSYYEQHLMKDTLAKRYDLQWWGALRDAAEAGDAVAKTQYEKYHHRPAEELYLVDDDPWELHNLADDPKHRDAKNRLRAELDRWMQDQDDPGVAMDDPAVQAANREAARKQ